MSRKTIARHQLVRAYRFVAARPSARRMNELLFDLSLHGLGIRNYENDVVSGEQHFIERVLAAHLEDATSPVVVDVGAHDGSYTAMVLKSFPRASAYCVEPHPATFRKLEDRLGTRATLLQCGLGAEAGELTLYDRADELGSQHASVYEAVISELHGQTAKGTQIAVRTLDDVALDHGLSRIDLLKIDTEGHELQVLHGAGKLIGAGAIGVVQIEFNEMNLVSRTFYRDFRQLLPDHTPYRLLPHGLLEISETPLRSELFGFQNIVFLPCR